MKEELVDGVASAGSDWQGVTGLTLDLTFLRR